jgi:aspartyl-tRNA(Asn)/glutamyl-tRNA(Gln) amidotransferase subunit A
MRSVPEIAAALRSQDVTAVTLAEQFLAREAEARDRLHSFVAIDASQLLDQAAVCDAELSAGHDRGPLHGIPVGIKDIIDVKGYPTRCGSPLYPSTPADCDATVVSRLRDAGAVIAGKTTSHELACGVVTSPVSNPWNLDHVPGGSSGGSGAAVAAGLVPVGLGSDTGGSIRIPAALCGTVGLKPTFDLLPLAGILPLSTTLDHVGPLGATVTDCAHAMSALVADGTDFSDGLDRGIAGMRFGVLTEEPFSPLQPDVESNFHAAVDVLRSLGADCVDITIPELTHTLAAEFGIIPLEAFEYHEQSLRQRPFDIDPEIRTLLTAGAVLPGSVYRRACAARVAIARAITAAMTVHRLDALVAPTLPATASPKADTEHSYGDVSEPIAASYVRTTAPFNLSGQPAISVPCGFDREGLPIGLQIATRARHDKLALQVAAAFEQASPSRPRVPDFW